MSTPDDLDRDAWLRHALQHAPDADAAPPAALSAAILAQAHAQVRSEAPAGLHHTPTQAAPQAGWGARLMAAWRWLAQPPIAAGFASVMLATVVGVMWWGQPLEQALPPRDVPLASKPEAVPPPPMAPELKRSGENGLPGVNSAAEAATARDIGSASPATRVTAAQTPRALPRPDSAPAPAPAEARAKSAASPPVRATGEAPTAAIGATREPPAESPPAPVMVDTPATAAPAGRAAGPIPNAAADRSREGRDDRRAAPAPERAIERGADLAAASSARGRMESAVQDLSAAAPRTLAAAQVRAMRPAVFDDIVRGGRIEPQRWSWQVISGTTPRSGTAPLAWLAQLDAAVGSRWFSTEGSANPPPAGEQVELRLWRDGQPHSAVRLDSDGVRLEALDAVSGKPTVTWRASLDASTAAALREAFVQATR